MAEQETLLESDAAQRVIEKCGGVAATAALVGVNTNWVHRWKYPRGQRGGTGGRIPPKAVDRLVMAVHRGEAPEGLTLDDIHGLPAAAPK